MEKNTTCTKNANVYFELSISSECEEEGERESDTNANETKCIYHNQFDCIYVKNLV